MVRNDMKDALFEPPQEFEPDLEWMLLSDRDQVSRDELATELVDEYYDQVFRLSLLLLGDKAWAERATEETFTEGVTSSDSYYRDQGVKVWLSGITVRVCRRYRGWVGVLRIVEKGVASIFRSSDKIAQEPGENYSQVIWEGIGSLKETKRDSVLLRYGIGLQVNEIAMVLDIGVEAIEQRLSSGLTGIEKILSDADVSVDYDGEQSVGELGALITRAIDARYPEITSPAAVKVRTVGEVLNLAEKRSKRRRRSNFVKVNALVGMAILIIVAVIMGVNMFYPDANSDTAPGTPVVGSLPLHERVSYVVEDGDTPELLAELFNVLPDFLQDAQGNPVEGDLEVGHLVFIPIDQLVILIPSGQAIKPLLSGERLSLNSDADEIRTRIQSSSQFWHTLWMDVQVISYGPQSYIGPAKVKRIQTWITQPGLRFQLVGSLGSNPEQIYRTINGLFLEENIGDEPFLKTSGNEYPDNTLLSSDLVYEMVLPVHASWVKGEGHFMTVDVEKIAGRNSLIVDWYDQTGHREARLWVDDRTGVVLRVQQFGGLDGSYMEREAVVTKIQLDGELPQEIFDPSRSWYTGFAADFRGDQAGGVLIDLDQALAVPSMQPIKRELISKTPPPDGFNPSESELIFEYQIDQGVELFPGNEDVFVVELFAVGYSIGQLEMGAPWTMLCDRSSDGMILIYATRSENVEEVGGLSWLNITDPGKLYRALPGFRIRDLEIAPDNRHVVIYGVGEGEREAGIYLLDVPTGDLQTIGEFHEISNLSWSPDGVYLSFLHRADGAQPGSEYIVMRVKSGQVVYQQPGDIVHPPHDWPGFAWGISYPITERDLDNCAQAPVNNEK